MKMTFAENVYNTLNDFYLSESCVPRVENAFEKGAPCMNLYEAAYAAYQRLCDKMGVVDEDEDIEIIFNSFLEINRILCVKMYNYGAYFRKLSID